jgi:hypothetical protein
MVSDLILGFLVLVAASYIGTTLALRGFFGRKRYRSPSEIEFGGPPGNGGSGRSDDRDE